MAGGNVVRPRELRCIRTNAHCTCGTQLQELCSKVSSDQGSDTQYLTVNSKPVVQSAWDPLLLAPILQAPELTIPSKRWRDVVYHTFFY